MDSLRAYYQPAVINVNTRQPAPTVSQTNEFFNPVVAHRWAGNFPLYDPEKKVLLELEQYPDVIFQHAPSFSYYPQHSNVDVNLF